MVRIHRPAALCAALMCTAAVNVSAALGGGTDATTRLHAALTEAASASAMSDEAPGKGRADSRALARLSEVKEAYPGTDAALTAELAEGIIRATSPGRWPDRIAPLAHIVAVSPDSWQAAVCHSLLADARSSRADFLAGKSKPDYAGAWELYQAARADAEAALERLPSVPGAASDQVRERFPLSGTDVLLASSHLALGYVDLRLGRVGEAIGHWSTVVDRFNRSPQYEKTRIPLGAREELQDLGIAAGPATPGERQAATVSAQQRLEAAGLKLSWDAQHRTASFAAGGLSVAFTPEDDLITVNGVAAHASPSLVSTGDDVRVPEKLLNACLAAIELEPLPLPTTAKSLREARELAKVRNAALAKLFAATR